MHVVTCLDTGKIKRHLKRTKLLVMDVVVIVVIVIVVAMILVKIVRTQSQLV